MFLRLFFLVLLVLWSIQPAASQRRIENCDPPHPPSFDFELPVISDYAISYKITKCPNVSLEDHEPIKLRVGQRLYFWFRILGSGEFLAAANDSIQILAHFKSHSFGFDRSIYVGTMNRGALMREVDITKNFFGWRGNGWRGSLLIPGRYTVWLQYGDQRICLSGQDNGECGIPFEVIAD